MAARARPRSRLDRAAMDRGLHPICAGRALYKTEATYRLLNREVRSKWDFGTSPTHQGYAGVIDDIQDARTANRSLGVLIAAGYTV